MILIINSFAIGFVAACVIMLIMLAIASRRMRATITAGEAKLKQMHFWRQQCQQALKESLAAAQNGDGDAAYKAIARYRLCERRFYEEADAR